MCSALKSIGAIFIFIIITAVEHLNPGQAAVIEFDQPLYAFPANMVSSVKWSMNSKRIYNVAHKQIQ